MATLSARWPLTKSGSSKQTYHIVLNIKNSGLEFKVGDSIGICPQNDPFVIDDVLNALRAKDDEQVTDTRSSETLSFRQFLATKANLARLTSSFLKIFHQYAKEQDVKDQLYLLLHPDNKAALTAYLEQTCPLQFFCEYGAIQLPLQEICAQFAPLLPRFYSVASSPMLLPDELHLTVALLTLPQGSIPRYGVAGRFLCHFARKHHPHSYFCAAEPRIFSHLG